MNNNISCEKEFGDWTVRLNGNFIIKFGWSFWHGDKIAKGQAHEVAWRIAGALQGEEVDGLMESGDE